MPDFATIYSRSVLYDRKIEHARFVSNFFSAAFINLTIRGGFNDNLEVISLCGCFFLYFQLFPHIFVWGCALPSATSAPPSSASVLLHTHTTHHNSFRRTLRGRHVQAWHLVTLTSVGQSGTVWTTCFCMWWLPTMSLFAMCVCIESKCFSHEPLSKHRSFLSKKHVIHCYTLVWLVWLLTGRYLFIPVVMSQECMLCISVDTCCCGGWLASSFSDLLLSQQLPWRHIDAGIAWLSSMTVIWQDTCC